MDTDLDRLSDRVEECWLGTDSLDLDGDTDNDGILDGVDALPLLDAEVPLSVEIVEIKDIHPGGSSCDVNNGAWDLYFTAYTYDLPALSENSHLHFEGWTKATHGHDYPDTIPMNAAVAVQDRGTATTTGNKAKFDLDPDLQHWGGGVPGLKLDLFFGPALADHDHQHGAHHDHMAFGTQVSDILRLGTPAWTFDSEHARDADTAHIHCQARIELTAAYTGLLEQVLDAAQAKLTETGDFIRCSHAELNDCRIDHSWSQ